MNTAADFTGIAVECNRHVTPGSTLYVRQKAVAGTSFTSEATKVTIPDQPAAPNSSVCTIDYINEKISFDSNSYEVNTAADFTGTAVLSVGTVTPGSTLYVRQKAVAGTSFASSATPVPIPERPAAPSPGAVDETVDGKHDAKITGVSTGMEYRKGETGT